MMKDDDVDDSTEELVPDLVAFEKIVVLIFFNSKSKRRYFFKRMNEAFYLNPIQVLTQN